MKKLIEAALVERQARQEEEKRAAEEAAEVEAVRQMLKDASASLAKADYPAAKEILRQLLLRDPDNLYALFYLAQVAEKEGSLAEAGELYGRVEIGQGVENWLRGWALVRMGRLLAFEGRFDEARSRFEEAQALEGDLRGAREESALLISKLPKK